MYLRIGYEMIYDCPDWTPMILTVHVHSSRSQDLLVPDRLTCDPFVPTSAYRDGFGNGCVRIIAPPGSIRLSTDALINDPGQPDMTTPGARQIPVQELPDEALPFLLGSRYCETDLLSQTAWQLFGQTPPGWDRVQAICDFVHDRTTFGYEHARATRTALETYHESKGVCRDYTHLAIALCRALNIPARYCTGYVSDIGVPPPVEPMDFATWFEAYLEGGWQMFDPRNNAPRIGRTLIARGRDAADVAITSTFGPCTLRGFRVWTDEHRGPPVLTA